MEKYIKDHAERLFKGRQMSYKPLLSIKADYPALLRCKINATGQRSARFWTPLSERCGPPAEFRDCNLVPRVQVRSMWIMGSEVGVC